MNFEALTGHTVIAEHEWRRAAEHFLGSVRTNSVVTYPMETSCEVPPDVLMNVADMQLQLRGTMENAVRYADGTTYRSYCKAMRKNEVWRFQEELPASPQLYLTENRLLSQLEAATNALELPGRTRAWYRAQYRAALKQSRRLSDLGREYEGGEDELYGKLTGASPVGRIRALFTPRSIHFRCEKKEDCAKLMYPDERTPSLLERRNEIQVSRGTQIVQKFPADMGGGSVSITTENSEVTKGQDAFGTFDHEQEHAMNVFAKHPSTSLGRAPRRESGLEFFARVGVSDTVKEELIAWSLRPHIHLPGLFLGPGATYHPVKTRLRQLREAKESEKLIDPFQLEAGQQLVTLVPGAANAVEQMMKRYPRSVVREMLRITPVHEWGAIAKSWTPA